MERWSWFLIGLVLIGISSCDSPTESKQNPYEQQPIEWPSLAKSPWPIYTGSPLGNGLSFFCKSIEGNIKWSYLAEPNIGSGLVINSKGDILTSLIIYAVICLSKEGQLKWEHVFYNAWDDVAPTPLIIKDDKIVYALKDEYVLLDSLGNIIKRSNLPGDFMLPSFQIDKEGNLYGITHQHLLFSITIDGEPRWQISLPDSLADTFAAVWWPIFAPSGNSLFVPGYKNIFSISTLGYIKGFRKIELGAPPIMTTDGRIVCFDKIDPAIVCLSAEDLKEIWRYRPEGCRICCSTTNPTLLPDGTIIIPISLFPDYNPGLLALNSLGKKSWVKSLPGNPNTWRLSDLVTTLTGKVFCAPYPNLVMIDNNGVIQWQLSQQFEVFSFPAIGKEMLYIGTYSQRIYAIN